MAAAYSAQPEASQIVSILLSIIQIEGPQCKLEMRQLGRTGNRQTPCDGQALNT